MQPAKMSLRNRLHPRLRRTNTWGIIAWLALIGWTLDALRLFLGMHETRWAGLSAFTNHFWYVVPVTIAIIVLTRLRPRAKLLGLALYDETGRLVHRQGDFHPDDLMSTAYATRCP